MTRFLALAILMAVLAPPHAEASSLVRVEPEIAERSVGNTAAEEIVAAIVEGSIRGSLGTARDSLDVEAVFAPGTESPSGAAPRRTAAAGGRSAPPAAASAVPRIESPGEARSTQASSAPAVETSDADSRLRREAAGEGVVGFWLLIVAGVSGALLFLGAGRRASPAARQR